MITAKLNRKISLLPQESCKKEKGLVGQFLQVSVQAKKEMAFKAFMEKMDVAEKSVEEYGYYSEEEVEEELAKI